MYRWTDDGYLRVAAVSRSDEVQVADSWLVDDGLVVGLRAHRARFLGSVKHAAPLHAHRAERAWDALIDALPRTGAHFPRIELRGDELLFHQRLAPARASRVVLATHQGADPRTHPTVKGPATDALARARQEAALRGADEAIIVGEQGIIEGAYSGVLWWEGNTLVCPDEGFLRVPSITAATVLSIATGLGVPLAQSRAHPEQLAGREVWTVSALHGIRVATAWVDGPELAAEPGRAARWSRMLERLRAPLPAGAQ